MKLYLVLYVFMIPNSIIVKSSIKKQCIKNILGQCVQPLVHSKVKTARSLAARDDDCVNYGGCVRTTTKDPLRSGPLTFGAENSSYDYSDVNWEVLCKLQSNGWNCGEKGFRHTFYYDIKLEGCKTTEIGLACKHNHNSFNTLDDCSAMCRDDGEHSILNRHLPPPVLCRLQPDFGECDGYHPSFYFDLKLRRCLGFSYSGCGGNTNRFETSQQCASACSRYVDFSPDETIPTDN